VVIFSTVEGEYVGNDKQDVNELVEEGNKWSAKAHFSNPAFVIIATYTLSSSTGGEEEEEEGEEGEEEGEEEEAGVCCEYDFFCLCFNFKKLGIYETACKTASNSSNDSHITQPLNKKHVIE
jgi:hypothetical protein